MKSNKFAFAVAATALFAGLSTGALADDKWIGDTGTNWLEHVKSTKSRAEVVAELNKAREQGELDIGKDSYTPRVVSGGASNQATSAGGAGGSSDSNLYRPGS